MAHTMFAPSIVYSPRDPFLRLLERMSLLPVMPISGSGQACRSSRSGPRMWPTACSRRSPAGATAEESVGARYELAGPETLTYADIVEIAAALVRPPPHRSCGVPTPVMRRTLDSWSSC